MANTLAISQDSSPNLITIPVEVRLSIIASLFSTITVHHGFNSKGNSKRKAKSKPKQPKSPTNTSILRVCKQLQEEALPLLPLHVLFHFRSPAAMLDTLTTLPRSIVEKIRHIQLKSYPFPVYSNPEGYYYTTYNMSETLCMLPGLQLDTLTVSDCYHDHNINDVWGDTGTYWDIQSLISVDGWKELRYHTPSTKFLTGVHDPSGGRKKQPEHWTREIRSKDKDSPDGFVKMYIAIAPKLRGLASNPLTRTDWEFEPRRLSDDEVNSEAEDNEDNDNDDGHREVMIVARRGNKANYVQDGTSLNKDLKALLERMSWEEVRESKYVDGEQDPSAHL